VARIAGRNGRLYVGITSSGTAEPIAYLSKWSLKFASDKFEVTSFGDTTKTYVAGLPDCQGTYNGFYDTATAQLYTAASDGVARKFYLYPDTSTVGQFWSGTAFFDFNIDGAVDGSVNIDGSFAAATAVSKTG
jgi:hypothetical protein